MCWGVPLKCGTQLLFFTRTAYFTASQVQQVGRAVVTPWVLRSLLCGRLTALDKRCSQLQKEKELIEKKMQRIEKAKETETGELKTQLEAVQGDIQAQLKLKDSKITEVRSAKSAKINSYPAAPLYSPDCGLNPSTALGS